MADLVCVSAQGGIGTVCVSRADVHNAFNEAVITALTEAFRHLAAAPEVRVVILRSEGKSFSAGADLTWMQKMIDYSIEDNLADARTLAAMLESIRFCPKPVLARVQGAALGGGVGLVAACDIAVALQSANFGLTEVRLGILPAVISPYVLEKIGPGPCRRYFLTAEKFSADEAYRLGLVNQVVATEADLDRALSTLCQALLQNGPEAVAAAKRLVSEVLGYDVPRWTDVTARRIAERRVSAEGQEGLRAFLDKRKASWLA
jgi:methylglutaconyl-CoA hydratase